MTIALLVLAWLAFGAGFIAGCIYATRPPEPQPPKPPVQLTERLNRDFYDPDTWREIALSRARQDLRDMLERGKW